jgi:DNA polymerase-3 subunit alpha
MSDDFCNIHLHTDGSVMDSPATIDEVLDTIKEKGQPGAALTDHGSMVNIVDWHRGCKARDLKPILGVEAYVSYTGIADKESVKAAKADSALAIESGNLGISHLVLLAKNYKGYQNLCRLSAIAHTDGYYYQPRIDYEVLEKHKEGLIVSSACMFGDFSKMVNSGDYTRAQKFAGKMKEVFGDDFYIELQNHGFEAQGRIVPHALRIAREVGVQTVVSQDVHYARPNDWKFQDALFCIGTKKRYEDGDRRTACREMYIKTRKQMEAMMSGLRVPKDSFDTTLDILSKVEDYVITPQDYLLPSLFGDAQKSKDTLRTICRKGWKELIGPKVKGSKELTNLYKERIEYELRVIGAAGFSDYFLIVLDFIRWAKDHGIKVGPGRGSAVGCLVAYVTGITALDPVKYNLLFERFLVEGRPSLPDIDVDVEDRDAVIQYLYERYGRDKVAPIINRTAVTAKAALIKVASILGDFKLGENLSKLIITKRGDTPSFEDAHKNIPALAIHKKDNPLLFELAEGLEGTITHLAGHASGVVVSSLPITDVAPLHQSKKTVYIAYDKAQLDYVKLVKLDILGLDTLRAVSETVRLIKERHGIDIDLQALIDEPSDPAAYKTLQALDCMGIFQFEGNAVRGVLKQVQASTIHDIAAINAIARPGPLDAGIDRMYARRKRGYDPVSYALPVLETILGQTYGLMIYQEQVMEIARVLADYNVIERDQIRKAMSDKDEKKIEIQRERFMSGAEKKGYPSNIVSSIFENIKLFGGYGFNKSHAYGYGILVYLTAWLKAYYPLEFIVACLNTMLTKRTKPKIEDVAMMVMDIEKHGFSLAPPSAVNSSGLFSISNTLDKNNNPIVYYALGAIKSISPTGMDTWLEMRPFKNLDDAVLKALQSKVGSDDIKVLAAVGAFSDLAPNQEYVVESMEARIAAAKKVMAREKRREKKAVDTSNEPSLFDMAFSPKELVLDMGDGEKLKVPSKLDAISHIKNELEYIGFALTGSLLDPYETHVRSRANMVTSHFATEVVNGEQNCHVAGVITHLRKRIDRHGNPYCFLTMSDGRTDIRVAVFFHVYSHFQESTWKAGKGIVVDGRKDDDALIASDVTFLRRDTDLNAKKKAEAQATKAEKAKKREPVPTQQNLGET